MAKKKFSHWLTVGELKAKLATMEDDTLVLRPSSDHSYVPAQYQLEEVVWHTRVNLFSEFADASLLEENDKWLKEVVVFR